MRQRNRPFSSYIFFLLLSLILFFIAGKTGLFTGLSSFIGQGFSAIGVVLYEKTHGVSAQKIIPDQNLILSDKLSQYKTLENENKALRDQFHADSSKTLDLLPARIVGAPNFIPGITTIDTFILEKGQDDSVLVGQAVISGNAVIGRIVKTTKNLSLVYSIFHKTSSFAGKDNETGALGIVKVFGNGSLLFDGILLSENLKVSDTIVTKGDMALNTTGYPPDLVIGKIISIEKKPSNLFQSARIKSDINFSKLSFVFIVVGLK